MGKGENRVARKHEEKRERIGSVGTSRGKGKIRGPGTPRGENTKDKGEERKSGGAKTRRGKETLGGARI